MINKEHFRENLSVEMRRLLAEIAFLASGYGLYKEGQVIFKFLELVTQGQVYPTIGQATICLNQGKPHQAAQLLEQAINEGEAFPAQEMANLRCFLGLALTLAGNRKASRKQLDLARSETAASPEIQSLARELMKQHAAGR